MSKGKYIIRIICFWVAILVGIFIFVYGGYDDSPGGQLIGFLLVVFGVVMMIKTLKKNKV
jgi:succinate-acetate transporter protein